eukprot:scaffold25721_cov63-Phaeocystis_antarctica.AAC.7
MYCGVPAPPPVLALMCWRVPWSVRASPTSATLAMRPPSILARRTFAGLRSRWRMLWEWMCVSPAAMSLAIFNRSTLPKELDPPPRGWRASSSTPPATYSTPRKLTTCWCLSEASVAASRRNAASVVARVSSDTSILSSLTATVEPCHPSSAERYTVPNAPAPNRSRGESNRTSEARTLATPTTSGSFALAWSAACCLALHTGPTRGATSRTTLAAADGMSAVLTVVKSDRPGALEEWVVVTSEPAAEEESADRSVLVGCEEESRVVDPEDVMPEGE